MRPALVITKDRDSAGEYYVQDTQRSPYNYARETLKMNLNDNDSTNSIYANDILSSGVKCRTGNTSYNTNGNYRLFFSWAEHPYGGANVSPSPAR